MGGIGLRIQTARAIRNRSFEALLAADVARLEREAVIPPQFDVDFLVPVALDEGRRIEERTARALAHRREVRSLEPLLRALAGGDPDTTFEGADGLRDLRLTAAAGALLARVEAGPDDDLVACAAHALVSMRSSEASSALDVLAGNTSAYPRRLAEVWS